MPAVIPFIPLIAAGVASGTSLVGAHMQTHAAGEAARLQTDAANRAAELQDAASQRSEAFLREQGQNAYQNNEVARRGNYDLYAAGQRRLGTLGEEFGYGPREVPGYVAGVDPHFTSGTIGAAAGAAPPDLGAIKTKFDALFPGETLTPEMLAQHRSELEALGFTLNPNARGQITDLSLPGGLSIDPIQGAGSGLNRKQWLVNGPGGSAPAPRAVAPRYVAPSVPFVTSTAPAPSLSYLGSY